METPERVLLIRPSALGDVCRTVPALVSLKRVWPSARIDWLVQDSFAPAVASHPDLSAVVPFERHRLDLRRLWLREGREALSRLLSSLRGPRYDLAVDLQGLGRSGLFAWLTHAKTRAGSASAGELGWLGLNRRVPVDRAAHTVDRMLQIVEALGASPVRDLRLYTSPEDRATLHPMLRGSRYALVAPTSRWEAKRWPDDRYALLIERLLAERAVDRVAVVASRHEEPQCGAILRLAARDDRIVNLIGRTTVGGLMAAVESAALVVANDSAALHMAVGFDRPLVGLFGPTRTDLVGPYGREADVIRAPIDGTRTGHKDELFGRRAMQMIDVQQVVGAALERLRAPGPRAHEPGSISREARAVSVRAGATGAAS